MSKTNPTHYQGDAVMQVIEKFHLDFCKGNAVKYILRAGSKVTETEEDDLAKAIWYLQRRLQQLEEE